jgi:hypothetical protein
MLFDGSAVPLIVPTGAASPTMLVKKLHLSFTAAGRLRELQLLHPPYLVFLIAFRNPHHQPSAVQLSSQWYNNVGLAS